MRASVQHLEAAELDEPSRPVWLSGQIELVDADLGAERVARHVEMMLRKSRSTTPTAAAVARSPGPGYLLKAISRS
jgi:hypothetical protein